jgi:tRNA threonylcarbamoyladenosine biosynthesis protein TsaB
MRILAFDTAFDGCSVCVAQVQGDGVSVLASAHERFETGHAERLVPMIDEVMAAAGVSMAQIDRVAVTVGPGTFTGTRIGIAAARGLALATGAEIVGASSLAVMAQVAAGELALSGDEESAQLLVAVDARRGEVYAQLFDRSGRDERSAPLLLTIEDASKLGEPAPLIVVGSGALAVAAAARSNGRRAQGYLPELLPDARALARIAAALVATQEPLQPLYLRPPDAKPQTGKSIARAGA